MCADRETIEQLMKTFSMIFRCVFQRIANTLDVAGKQVIQKGHICELICLLLRASKTFRN